MLAQATSRIGGAANVVRLAVLGAQEIAAVEGRDRFLHCRLLTHAFDGIAGRGIVGLLEQQTKGS